MHSHDHRIDAEPAAVLLAAVRETARSACHLAGVAGRLPSSPDREGVAEAAAQASLEAGLHASRALFTFEDALHRRPEGPAPLGDALAALQAAEEALRAARQAIESRVSRTLRPETVRGAAVRT